MVERKPDLTSKLASFYYVAEDYEQVEEEEISPSLHAISRISERYESAEFLASGGMKQVFKVYDARCKRHVAMATLHDDAPVELCDPFIHEAWLTALLDHPNIITIHDVGVDSQNRPYFTMDLKSGNSLSELIEKLRASDPEIVSRYSLESLLHVFVKICDAIAYAHSIQVLHLDLKPANIQVGQYGEVLVCDWGLGRLLGREDGLELERRLLHPDLLSSDTLFGQARGTPGYMAPEQIEKDNERDARTDVYGLGCILYSILTLQCPLDGEAEAVLENAKLGAITPPSRRAADRDIPKSLEAEQTLMLYEAGIGELEKLSFQNAKSVERAVIGLHLYTHEKRAEQLLLAALDAEPDNPVYLRSMGEHYFIMQRFNQASEYLDRGEKRDRYPDQLVCDLAHKYSLLKPDDDRRLTTDQMVDLLRRISDFDGFEAMIVLNDQRQRVDPNERAVIIQEHLRSINPDWHDGWFEYDFASSRLRVGGKGLTRLAASPSVLAGLQPRTLDISGSEISDLRSETGYAIESLDVRGCPLDGVHYLRRFVHLKKLVIHPGQLTQQELAMLPDWVEVIQEPLTLQTDE